MKTTEQEKKTALEWLQRARRQIIDEHPFLGFGSMRLAFTERDTCPTLATNGQDIFYNPRYVLDTRTSDYPAFVYAVGEVLHETAHCLFGHCRDWTSMGFPNRKLVNVSQDFVINAMLKKMGVVLHPSWLYAFRFEKMTWQEVYKILEKETSGGGGKGQKGKPEDGKGSGDCPFDPQDDVEPQPDADDVDGEGKGKGKEDEKKDGKGSSPSSDPSDGQDSGGSATGEDGDEDGEGSGDEGENGSSKYNDWDNIVQEATEFAQSMGKCPGEIRDYARGLVKPRYNWKATLYRFMSAYRKGEYSYRRPNKRYLSQGVVMPSLHSYTADALIGVDASGSTIPLIPGFLGHLAEVSHILGVPVDVVEVDTRVQNVFRLKKGQDVTKLFKDIGGGTDFRPFFDWVAKLGRRPEVVIFFTDGYGSYPDKAPGYRVLWCIPDVESIKGTQYYPPFGTVINIPSEGLR